MTGKNPYAEWVQTFVNALRVGEAIGTAPRIDPENLNLRGDAPTALLFAPHPDDEVITGALPLRLLRELGFAVTDVAVTLGSKVERRSGRLRELEAACCYLGFGLINPDRTGLEGINLAARERDPARWALAVEAIMDLLAVQRPSVVFMPHTEDWNTTHVGTHFLVAEAMRRMSNFSCLVVETEYWRPLAEPNLMIESSAADVADLVAALSQHVGEVSRNPYHLRLPAWMMDNVRRGAELVGGQGTDAPGFVFATLYRLRAFSAGQFHDVPGTGRFLGVSDKLHETFPSFRGA